MKTRVNTSVFITSPSTQKILALMAGFGHNVKGIFTSSDYFLITGVDYFDQAIHNALFSYPLVICRRRDERRAGINDALARASGAREL